jgi:1,4-dihydroxy-6-naphthoate synthase
MNLSIAFSPCPNDTFMFDALVNKKIDNKNIDLNIYLADIDNLNQSVYSSKYDISKISYHVYPYISDKYQLLTSGSALGFNNGPILISKRDIDIKDLDKILIAIPGIHTTANLLLNIFFPEARNKKVFLFSEIEDAINSGEADAGVIIHESRFTYEQKGLKKIIDFGQQWQKYTNMPLPLGGIAIKRGIDNEVKLKINQLIYESVSFALKNPQESRQFVKKYSQSLDDTVINRHINLYVNEFSLDLGYIGKKAIIRLFNESLLISNLKISENDIFVV